MDDTDPRLIWRSLGRGLDRRYPPDGERQNPFEDLLDALRRRDQSGQHSDQR